MPPNAREKVFKSISGIGVGFGFVFMAGILLLFTGLAKKYPALFLLSVAAYVASVILQIVGDVGQRKLRHPFFTMPALLMLYTVLAFWEFITIPMILLIVVASMLSGPFMVLVAVLSALMLGLYFIEEIIGHDIQGVSSFDNGAQALLALGALIVSGAVLWAVHFGSDDDLIMDKGADIIAGIHSLIKSAADDIIEKYSA